MVIGVEAQEFYEALLLLGTMYGEADRRAAERILRVPAIALLTTRRGRPRHL